jgi:hypothetical protein
LEQLASKTEESNTQDKNAWSDDEQLMQIPKKQTSNTGRYHNTESKSGRKISNKPVKNDSCHHLNPAPGKHEDNMDKNKERTRKKKQPRQRQKERLSIYNNNKKEKE